MKEIVYLFGFDGNGLRMYFFSFWQADNQDVVFEIRCDLFGRHVDGQHSGAFESAPALFADVVGFFFVNIL